MAKESLVVWEPKKKRKKKKIGPVVQDYESWDQRGRLDNAGMLYMNSAPPHPKSYAEPLKYFKRIKNLQHNYICNYKTSFWMQGCE